MMNQNADLYGMADEIARLRGIPTDLFRNLIATESSWNPQAKSQKGNIGLTQLGNGVIKDYGVNDPLDPRQNLDGGARFLADQYKRFGSWPLALAAYNAGPENVVRAGNQVPNFPETQQYIPKVMNGVNLPEDRPAPAPAPQVQAPTPTTNTAPVQNEMDRKPAPVANEAYKKFVDDKLDFLPQWARDIAKERGPGTKGGDKVAGFSSAGLAGLENNAPLPFDARQDHGQQLTSLIGLLIGDKLGGARSRQRVK